MLHMKNPRLWWCNNLGTPELYDLKLEFVVNNQVSDKEELKFGVREIKDYFTDNGYRGFILNGKKFLLKELDGLMIFSYVIHQNQMKFKLSM